MHAANLTAKQARSSFSEPGYGHQVWGANGGRFELAQLLPPVLVVGLLFLLLPLCASLVAPLFAGHGAMNGFPYAHGRRRRSADQPFWSAQGAGGQLLQPLLDTLQKSLRRFAGQSS